MMSVCCWKHLALLKSALKEVIYTFEDAQGQVFTLPKKGGKKVRRVYIKRIVELLNLQQWQDESSDQSTDDN